MEIPQINEKVEKPMLFIQDWQNDQLIQTHRKITGRNPLTHNFYLLESISEIGTNIFIVVILIKKKSLKPT